MSTAIDIDNIDPLTTAAQLRQQAADMRHEAAGLRREADLQTLRGRQILRQKRNGRLMLAAYALAIGVCVTMAVLTYASHDRAMARCQAQFATQFVANPDGRPVWTSAACSGLDLDDLAAVQARTVVAHQIDAERANAAARR